VNTPTMPVQVRRDGNRATVTGPFGEVFFEIDDPGIEIARDDFAVWVALAFAMSDGGTIRLDAPVDPSVAANAHKISRIWNAWLPKSMHMVQVDAETAVLPSGAAKGRVMAFSGGIDSTYSLVRYREALDIERLVTIHGFDYRLSDRQGFHRLVEKNRAIASAMNTRLTVVRTNLFVLASPWRFTHVIGLAAILWLFTKPYGGGLFSADLARHEDFLNFPYGTNGVTNRLFGGSDFRVDPLGDDVTRPEKVAAVLARPDLAPLVTLCPKAQTNGQNCGRCDKCLLGKLICLAVADRARPIFADDELTNDAFRQIEKGKRLDFRQAIFRDIHQIALDRGNPDLARRIASMFVANRKLKHQRDVPPHWWRINLNLRNRLGLRKGRHARSRAQRRGGNGS